jgi:hypothetical protein
VIFGGILQGKEEPDEVGNTVLFGIFYRLCFFIYWGHRRYLATEHDFTAVRIESQFDKEFAVCVQSRTGHEGT